VRRVLSAGNDVVEIGDVSAVDAAATELLQHLHQSMGMGPPPTYLGPGVQPSDVATIFDTAAAFHQAAPWDIVPDDGCVFRLRCAQVDLDVVACIIGQAGQSFGLALYASLDEYKRWRDEFDGDEPPEDLPSSIGLHFERRSELPPQMLAEIAQHRWKVARDDAVPLIIRSGVGLTPELATAPDLRQLNVAARAVAAIVQRDGKAIRRMRRERKTTIAPVDVHVGGENLRVLVDAFALE
jgi:hypothetical protein